MSLMMSLHIVKIYFSLNFNILRGMLTLAGIIQNNAQRKIMLEDIPQNPVISKWIELLFQYFH